MRGWGARLIGFGSVMDALGDVQTRLTDSGVYVVGTRASYAAYVEFGTSRAGAQPYLLPAARDAQRNPAGYISTHTDTSLDQLNSVDAVVKTIALAIERDAKERCPVDVGNLRASITSAPLSEFGSAAEDAIDSAPNPEALRA